MLWSTLCGYRYTLLPTHKAPPISWSSWIRAPLAGAGILFVFGIVFYARPLYTPSGRAIVDLLPEPPDSGPSLSLPLPPSFWLHRLPRKSVHENSTLLNETLHTAFTLTEHPRPTCPIHDWHRERYKTLLDSRKTLFLAMNLHDNANVSPNILQELPVLLRLLGPQNVHISVYESGSSDETPHFLLLLAHALEALGASYDIVSRGREEAPEKDFNHRIQVLAAVRNAAMKPLYDGLIAQHMPGERFDNVLVLNDVIWCTVDVLEVLYQKQERGAHEACSVDWDWNGRIVYDRWVLRAMSGRPWYEHDGLVEYFHDERSLDEKPIPVPLPSDPEDHDRFVSLLPLQVFSCWNGMAAFTADVFLKYGIRFRGAHSDHEEDGSVKEPSDIASECYLTSVDMWKAKIGKIVLASRARVAYDVWDYDRYRTDTQIGEMGPEAARALAQKEAFDWVTTPPEMVAMHDFAWWEDPERWAPWDEP